MELETYEWSHFWWERSEVKEGRLLISGDSICHGYTDIVRSRMQPIPVDSLSTSFSLDNPGLIQQLSLFLENTGLKYSAIHFNNGLHGKHITTEQYKELYTKTAEYLVKHANGARIILALSTPVTENDKIHYQKFNNDVIERNDVVNEIAKNYGLEVDDLYSVVDGKAEIQTGDGYHFLREGYELLSDAVCSYIKC